MLKILTFLLNTEDVQINSNDDSFEDVDDISNSDENCDNDDDQSCDD